jgi:hypothetical protein
LGIKIDDSIEDAVEETFNEMVTKKEQPLPDLEQEQKKKVFKAPPKSLELEFSDELSEECLVEKIRVEEEHIREMITIAGLSDKKTYNFDEEIEKLKVSKNYSPILTDLKTFRQYELLSLKPQQYLELCKNHYENVKKIFVQKNYTEKKLEGVFQRLFFPLEQRLLKLSGYTKSIIEADEIDRFKTSLYLSVKHPKFFSPFNHTRFYEFLANYGLALLPLNQLITMYVSNVYGFANLIYLPIVEDNDPYSFYYLEKVDDKRRCWKMDCRLEDITSYIADTINLYTIELFRKIYFDVFNHNNYLPNYQSRAPILEMDCSQLLYNLCLVNNFPKFNLLLRTIIKTEARHVPTHNDKVDFYKDDKLQQKRFATLKTEENEILDIIKQLFDKITDEELREFLKYL